MRLSVKPPRGFADVRDCARRLRAQLHSARHQLRQRGAGKAHRRSAGAYQDRGVAEAAAAARATEADRRWQADTRSRRPDRARQPGQRRRADQPVRNGFINAVQVYPFSGGALYQVYTAPGEITDIALQDGEQLVGSGPVAAGDTVRWIIGDTESGAGATKKIHILVKPTRPELLTNLVINTDRRTYLLELRSTEKTYMASVSWQYPEDQLIALRRQNQEADAAAPIASGVDLASINFRYAIQGDNPAWRPLRAFDDGHKVYIEFPSGIAQGEMPPLFVIGPAGGSELVNYRVNRNYYIVDRLFAAAELRLGDKDSERRVRIVRTDGRPRS